MIHPANALAMAQHSVAARSGLGFPSFDNTITTAAGASVISSVSIAESGEGQPATPNSQFSRTLVAKINSFATALEGIICVTDVPDIHLLSSKDAKALTEQLVHAAYDFVEETRQVIDNFDDGLGGSLMHVMSDHSQAVQPQGVVCNESYSSLASLRVHNPVQVTDSAVRTTDDAGIKMLNDYVLMDKIGEGSCGKVKLGFDMVKGVSVAIKIVRRTHSTNSEAAMRQDSFEREIAVMKKLRHKHIVALHEVIDDPDAHKLYLVMQYVDKGPITKVGEDLTCAPVPIEQLNTYARHVCAGLAYLHNHNVVHRDIKPENILVSSDGNAYLADFGVSEMFADESSASNSHSVAPSHSPGGGEHIMSKSIVCGLRGTFLFMGPELVGNDAGLKVDGRALDVWALGVTFLTLLTGKVPFESFNQIAQGLKPVKQRPEVIAADIPAPWWAILDGMLATAPEERWTIDVVRAKVKAVGAEISKISELSSIAEPTPKVAVSLAEQQQKQPPIQRKKSLLSDATRALVSERDVFEAISVVRKSNAPSMVNSTAVSRNASFSFANAAMRRGGGAPGGGGGVVLAAKPQQVSAEDGMEPTADDGFGQLTGMPSDDDPLLMLLGADVETVATESAGGASGVRGASGASGSHSAVRRQQAGPGAGSRRSILPPHHHRAPPGTSTSTSAAMSPQMSRTGSGSTGSSTEVVRYSSQAPHAAKKQDGARQTRHAVDVTAGISPSSQALGTSGNGALSFATAQLRNMSHMSVDVTETPNPSAATTQPALMKSPFSDSGCVSLSATMPPDDSLTPLNRTVAASAVPPRSAEKDKAAQGQATQDGKTGVSADAPPCVPATGAKGSAPRGGRTESESEKVLSSPALRQGEEAGCSTAIASPLKPRRESSGTYGASTSSGHHESAGSLDVSSNEKHNMGTSANCSNVTSSAGPGSASVAQVPRKPSTDNNSSGSPNRQYGERNRTSTYPEISATSDAAPVSRIHQSPFVATPYVPHQLIVGQISDALQGSTTTVTTVATTGTPSTSPVHRYYSDDEDDGVRSTSTSECTESGGSKKWGGLGFDDDDEMSDGFATPAEQPPQEVATVHQEGNHCVVVVDHQQFRPSPPRDQTAAGAVAPRLLR